MSTATLSVFPASIAFQCASPIDSGDWGWANPAGGMVSSSADLAKVVKLLLRFDAADPGLTLDSQTLWEMMTTNTESQSEYF